MLFLILNPLPRTSDLLKFAGVKIIPFERTYSQMNPEATEEKE